MKFFKQRTKFAASSVVSGDVEATSSPGRQSVVPKTSLAGQQCRSSLIVG